MADLERERTLPTTKVSRLSSRSITWSRGRSSFHKLCEKKLLDDSGTGDPPQMRDVEAWVEEFGDRLFRYALLRTGKREIAEDLVQETFLAAVNSLDRFRQDAAPMTWLSAILRRKIADHFRRCEKHHPESLGTDVALSVETDWDWPSAAQAWSVDPGKIVEDREFWEVFGRCLRSLPPTLTEAYILRDLEGETPKNICELLGISGTNLSMRLKRARVAMRDLLQEHWFSAEQHSHRELP